MVSKMCKWHNTVCINVDNLDTNHPPVLYTWISIGILLCLLLSSAFVTTLPYFIIDLAFIIQSSWHPLRFCEIHAPCRKLH